MAHLQAGIPAPDFQLKAAYPGGEEAQACLAAFAGRWLVLYFYPKDNTSGCTTEAMEFTQLVSEFTALNACVIGVSKDSLKSHHGFIAKKGLKIPLLSDPQGETLETYGAWGEKKNCGKTCMGTIRSTVLIDPQGIVVRHWPTVKSAGHAAGVLDELRRHAG